ncbi:MAG: hypothetical protein JST66_11315 [Bacteroidetes bacterium]|nr:hypothetical protein [Bacteroidota bacterium]
MKHPGILLSNLLIMLGYSVLFLLLGRWVGGDLIGVQWGVLLVHILVLFVLGLAGLFRRTAVNNGRTLLLASLLVAIIGHGLCFFNGLMHLDLH